MKSKINREFRRLLPGLSPSGASAQVWKSAECRLRGCACGADDEPWNRGRGWGLEVGNVLCLNAYFYDRRMGEWLMADAHIYFEITQDGPALLGHLGALPKPDRS